VVNAPVCNGIPCRSVFEFRFIPARRTRDPSQQGRGIRDAKPEPPIHRALEGEPPPWDAAQIVGLFVLPPVARPPFLMTPDGPFEHDQPGISPRDTADQVEGEMSVRVEPNVGDAAETTTNLPGRPGGSRL
jgi:hypothetical protein